MEFPNTPLMILTATASDIDVVEKTYKLGSRAGRAGRDVHPCTSLLYTATILQYNTVWITHVQLQTMQLQWHGYKIMYIGNADYCKQLLERFSSS